MIGGGAGRAGALGCAGATLAAGVGAGSAGVSPAPAAGDAVVSAAASPAPAAGSGASCAESGAASASTSAAERRDPRERDIARPYSASADFIESGSTHRVGCAPSPPPMRGHRRRSMSEGQAKYLDTFPAWLRTLADDAERMASLLEEPSLSEAAREAVAGGLNYLFKSLDLIPDGIDDIGYLDDAFVLRVAADLALREDNGEVDPEKLQALGELANECEIVREFLGDNYARLEAYVRGLRRGAARGRSVADILGNEAVRSELLADIRGFASSYQVPTFSREEKNLIKLRAFFDAKLPK
jgi:uncharacterized membrane protein YkvA (DUF1232 family)